MVVHVLDSRRPLAGCVHAHIDGLMSAMRTHGYDGRLVAVNGGRELVVRETGEGGAATWAPLSESALRQLLQHAAGVHIHGPQIDQWRTLRGLFAGGPPVLVSSHAGLLPHPWRRPGMWQRLSGWLSNPAQRWRFARALHATNDREAEYLRRIHDDVEVIPVGVCGQLPESVGTRVDAGLGPALERRCLLFLGPIDPLQGLVPMLKACELVVPSAPDWHLVIAGPVVGRWLDMIRPAVERRGLSDRVTFVLDPDLDQQGALLSHSEIVIQPSLLAAPPFSALSGLVRGRPCVVSSHCQLTHENAPWARSHEPGKEALAEALGAALETPRPDHESLGRCGRDWVLANRVWDVLAPAYAGFYQRCLS